MKIAVVAKTRLPIAEPFRGGLESFTHALCKAYNSLGHQVTLYAHLDSDPSLNVKGFAGDENREHKHFEIFEHDEYLSILEDIAKSDADIVHNNSTHELPILWGTKARIPVVTTIHTPPISKLKAAIKMCSSSKNLHFILPSKSFASTWQPYIDNKSTVIYNGVDLDKWPLSRKTRDYLFWYGRIVQAKGLDIVMDAAHELNIPLKFAGPIDDEQYFAEHIGPRIGGNDMYLGHLRQNDLQAYMKGAAAIASAVRWEEPFGLTNLEAMASGVPVAGFDRGAFHELVDVGSGVIAQQKNVKSLAKAIGEAVLLNSETVRNRAEKFSLKTTTENYIKFFQAIS